MKGRSTNAAERRYHDALCSIVGCIACRKDANINHWVSIHHIDGRTKPDAHWLVLPLCASHHQDDGTAVAVHPYKARFEALYGAQIDLKRACDALVREVYPHMIIEGPSDRRIKSRIRKVA